MRMHCPPRRHRTRPPRGIALITALIFLTVISLLVASALRFSAIGLRSAVNEELRIVSFITAQSAVDAALVRPENLPVSAGTGQTYCTAGSDCDHAIVSLPDALFADQIADGTVAVSIRRMDPEFAPPPRGSGASVSRFYAASFQASARHDQTGTGFGRTELSEGLILILPYH